MRLSPKDLRAFRTKELRLLASPCRDVGQAQAELRWIREHCETRRQVRQMCVRRHRHVPLQYLLGRDYTDDYREDANLPASQPFGPFDLRCRPGVLIPRWETEAWAAQIADEVEAGSNVLDLCTGSGCIALMLAQKPGDVVGIDLSPHAIKLARENLGRNAKKVQARVRFRQLDIYGSEIELLVQQADVLVANPPYISQADQRGLSLSTRRYEPHLALFADDQGDAFYHRIATMLKASKAYLVALEIGSSEQATNVVSLFPSSFRTEVWEDAAGQDRVVVGRRHRRVLHGAAD